MRLSQLFLVLLFLCISANTSFASNAYQPELTLIAQGHPSQAYSNLRPKLTASAGNPEFDTAFGLAALDSGAPAEAITAFERILALNPANLPIRTELARAYAEVGDPAAAKRELELVKTQPQTPADVKQNLSNYSSILDTQLSGGPRTINAILTVTTGYDTNINTATTSSYLVVPALSALGPARLSNGSQAEDSAYTEVGATITARQPLTPNHALFAAISANTKAPFESSDYAQTTLGAEGGLQITTPDYGRFALSLSAQQFWFGGDDYSSTLAANANWQIPLTQTTNLTTYGTASHITYQTAQPSANRGVIGITLDSRWQTAYPLYAFAGAYGGAEETEGTAADYFSHTLIGTQLGFEVFPTQTLSAYFDARLEQRNYDDTYPLFLTAREDTQLDLTTGLSYALTSNLSLRPSLSYRYVESNIGFYDYTRWLANLSLRYAL